MLLSFVPQSSFKNDLAERLFVFPSDASFASFMPLATDIINSLLDAVLRTVTKSKLLTRSRKNLYFFPQFQVLTLSYVLFCPIKSNTEKFKQHS